MPTTRPVHRPVGRFATAHCALFQLPSLKELPMAGLSLSQRPASMAHAGLGSCTRALLLTVPLALAACGGGSSSDSDTAAPPSGLNVGYGTKAYHFSWSAAPNATRYELFEDPDGAAGPQPEVQIGGAITGTAYTHSLAVNAARARECQLPAARLRCQRVPPVLRRCHSRPHAGHWPLRTCGRRPCRAIWQLPERGRPVCTWCNAGGGGPQ